MLWMREEGDREKENKCTNAEPQEKVIEDYHIISKT